VCRRTLTKGVEQRVEELADRSPEFKRGNAPGFLRLLPLSEIIATVLGTGSPSTQAVWKNYNSLTERFRDEYSVLIEASLEELAKVVDTPIAQAIIRVRDGNAKVTPGYDGVYGQLVLGIDVPPAAKPKPKLTQPTVKQKSMSDFW
jgi:PHP family Zn ribbon phosphoesterase